MERDYETVIIVDGSLSSQKIDATVQGVEDHLNQVAKVKSVERRGSRRMAYTIKRKTHGFYAVYSYQAEGEAVKGLARKLRLDETVLRFLTVRKERAQLKREAEAAAAAA